MALFGKKDPCAICGGKVKGIFPWKVGGEQVCNECYGAVDLPKGMVDHMSIADFRGYMAFRSENALLRQQFNATQIVDFGWLDDKFMFDMTNGLLCMDKKLATTIYEAKQIKSFVIREDSTPLYEGSAAGLICYASTVPDRLAAMAPQIAQLCMQMQTQRTTERLVDILDGDDNDTSYRPRINIPEPFKSFVVEINFDHPYWRTYTADMNGPTFSDNNPNIDVYLNDYRSRAATVAELAQALMDLAFPNAPRQNAAAPAAAATAGQPVVMPTAAPVDAVAEIQRFKALMEQGVITEEEFAAKKRQLLGI